METQKRTPIAESFASLSIGLWTVSLIGYLTSGISWMMYFLIVIGVISMLLAIYLLLPWHWKQESVVGYLERGGTIGFLKLLVWLIVLVIFGVGLVQTKIIWMIITGLVTSIIAFIVFYVGLGRMKKGDGKTIT